MTRLLSVIGIALVLCVMQIRAGEVPPSLSAIASAIRHSCLETTGATNQQVDDASYGKFADDNKLKCYISCVMEKFALVVDGTKIDFELMAMILPPDMKASGLKMINNCKHITGNGICETAFLTMKCFYETVPEDFFII